MILIADSGSTQCTWLIGEGSGFRRVETPGINAIHQPRQQILAALALVPPCTGISEVHFYGAGCGPQFPEATEKMAAALKERFGAERVKVESDLVGAARALFGRGEGIASILGTGSNSCHCRGGRIVATVPPLGYILGDEGSGAVLGRNLLNGVFKGHIPLRDELLAATGMSYEQIIRRVYAEPAPNCFLASLAPFVCAHTAVSEVREMVHGSFRDFAARNLSRYPADLPVSFVGGVAAHFEELLREAMHEAGRRVQLIVQSPAEGLIAYHHGA